MTRSVFQSILQTSGEVTVLPVEQVHLQPLLVDSREEVIVVLLTSLTG